MFTTDIQDKNGDGLHSIMKNRASYTLEIFKIFIFSFFYHFGYHCIHHFFYHLFYHLHFFIICFIIFYHFFNHFLIIFFIICLSFFKSFFIIFSSSGAKIFQEMENYNFPRVFIIFLSCFYHFCFQWWN